MNVCGHGDTMETEISLCRLLLVSQVPMQKIMTLFLKVRFFYF